MRFRSQRATLISISFAFLLGSGAPNTASSKIRVEDQGLEIIPDGIHMNMFVDQLNGLRTERVHRSLPVPVEGFNGLVDLRQPPVSVRTAENDQVKSLPETAE